MRAWELSETRKATMQYFMKEFPNVPEYVVRDFMYKNYKDDPKGMDYEFGLWLNDLKWTKEKLFITLDFFDEDTQKLLKPRLGGKKAFFIPNDEERHKKQAEMLKKQGVSDEPIIITKTEGEYGLQEGWHRVIQALKIWPEGYEQNAWVGEE